MARLPWRQSNTSRKPSTWGSAEALAELVKGWDVGEVRLLESMKKHTTLKVGGPADVFAIPKDEESVRKIMVEAKKAKIPVTPIGNGSNLLVRDGGIPGIAMSLKGLTDFAVLEPEKGRVRVGSGVPMNRLIRFGLEQQYEGIWYLTGIPGTVGGALKMNAGTRHGEIESVVKSIRYFSRRGAIKEVFREDLDFEYRALNLEKGAIITSGVLELGKAEVFEEIKKRHREVLKYRMDTQPLQLPACGSVFRNPENDAAGRLIEKCGLKGVRIRGAQVSEKHANWIVNVGEAQANDILVLMRSVHERVAEREGIKLIPEVQVIGVDD